MRWLMLLCEYCHGGDVLIYYIDFSLPSAVRKVFLVGESFVAAATKLSPTGDRKAGGDKALTYQVVIEMQATSSYSIK